MSSDLDAVGLERDTDMSSVSHECASMYCGNNQCVQTLIEYQLTSSSLKKAASLVEKADGMLNQQDGDATATAEQDSTFDKEDRLEEEVTSAMAILKQGFSFQCLIEGFVQAQVEEALEVKQLTAKLAESPIAQQLWMKFLSALVKSVLDDLYRQSEEEAELVVGVATGESTESLLFAMEEVDIVYPVFAVPDEETGEDEATTTDDIVEDSSAGSSLKKGLFRKPKGFRGRGKRSR